MPGRPAGGLRKAVGIGGNPVDVFRPRFRAAPLEESVRGNDHFVVDAFRRGGSAAVEGGKDLIAASVNEGSDIRRRAGAVRGERFETGNRGYGGAVDLTPSLDRGEAYAYASEGAGTGGDGVQLDIALCEACGCQQAG